MTAAPSDLLRTGLRQHFRPDGLAKRSFDTREEADAFAATLHSSKRRPYESYRCGVCHRWHVGRRRARKRRRSA